MVVLAATPILALALGLVGGAFTNQAAARPPSGGGSAGNSNNTFAVGGITPPTSMWPSLRIRILKTEATRVMLCRIALESHGVAP